MELRWTRLSKIDTQTILMSGCNIGSGKMGNAMQIPTESTSLTEKDNKMPHTGISKKRPREKGKTVE
jgi:hypothetical protein